MVEMAEEKRMAKVAKQLRQQLVTVQAVAEELLFTVRIVLLIKRVEMATRAYASSAYR